MKKIAIFILLATLFAIVSCSDDDTFTTSRNNLLSFSIDTLRLDTTFSNVPTSTKTFWVYNQSGDGLRLSNVRLAQGNQTGFRVNVDGVELSAVNGFQANDLEVRNKDSIRVFVEMTSPFNNAASPQELSDDLVFTLESGVQQRVNLRVYSWDAQLIKGLRIARDTTITSSRPIVFQDTITVAEGATLSISAGTTLYFSNTAGIDVYGTLRSEGTAEQPVTLRGDRLDKLFPYLPYDRVSGQWQGIRFHKDSYNNLLSYTDLHSTYNGVVCDSAQTNQTKLTIANSTIHNCQGFGLQAINSRIEVYNSQFSNTLFACASFIGGDAQLTNCTFAQFYPFDSNRGSALSLSNALGTTDYPVQNFTAINCLATGYADDVVNIAIKEGVVFNYHFDHCLLRMEQPTDGDALSRFTEVMWENVNTYPNGGYRQFVAVDADRQYYDFHLKLPNNNEVYPAINTGIVIADPRLATDRDGKTRDNRPDIGCFEAVADN